MFAPSAQTGVDLRLNFNNSFVSSLEYIFSVCEPHLRIDGGQVARLISRIRSGSRETPFLYSLHFRVIEAIQRECMPDVERHLEQLLNLDQAADRYVLAGLASDDLPWDADITTAYFADGDDTFFRYAPPDPDKAALVQSKLSAALDMIGRFAPGLAAEMRELITTVIIARGIALNDSSTGQVFESSTALRAFGGVLLNADYAGSVVAAATTLIHEEAHTLLFALSPNEGVVLNPDSERYSSPLREDPRPLEGIFHQTFVLARMIYGMDLLRSSAGASPTECDFACGFMQQNMPRFEDAVTTVRCHARLTDAGEMALRAAENHMATIQVT